MKNRELQEDIMDLDILIQNTDDKLNLLLDYLGLEYVPMEHKIIAKEDPDARH